MLDWDAGLRALFLLWGSCGGRMRAMLQRTVRWLMVVILLVSAAPSIVGETVAALPAPTGYVNDFAGVLTPETRQNLDDLCTQVDQQAHAQIPVGAVKSN